MNKVGSVACNLLYHACCKIENVVAKAFSTELKLNLFKYEMGGIDLIRLNTGHWKDERYKQGTLLFAQTLLECVFMYSFDSYKAPALNIHFLCYDFNTTVNLVEQKDNAERKLNPAI